VILVLEVKLGHRVLQGLEGVVLELKVILVLEAVKATQVLRDQEVEALPWQRKPSWWQEALEQIDWPIHTMDLPGMNQVLELLHSQHA
jgi:hypothetical protein